MFDLRLTQVATNLLDPQPESLEKVSQLVVSTVDGGTALFQNKTELTRAADILLTCVNLAMASPERGIGSTVAIAMLEALASVNEVGRLGESNNTAELLNFTKKMESLASSMATAALAKLQVGESAFISGAVGGKGTSLQLVSTLASALTDNGLQIERLYMPPSLLTTSRRLQALEAGCSDVGIKATYWQRTNPYTWASSSKGVNQYVSSDATVAVLEFDMCGLPLSFNESIPERTLRLRPLVKTCGDPKKKEGL